MTINQYEKQFRELFTEEKAVKAYLGLVLSRIKFLESIYMTGGLNEGFSEQFRNSAYKEREELCKESSALYEILRTDYKPLTK